MKIILIGLIIFAQIAARMCFAQANSLRAQKIEELNNRVRELEKKQSFLDSWYIDFYTSGASRVTPFLGSRLTIGGFFETGLVNIYGPNTENQISAYSHVLGFNVSADYTDRTRFVAQTLSAVNVTLVNPNNNPNLAPPERKYMGLSAGSVVAQGFFEYSGADYFNIQTGIGYVPFGISYQQRESYLFRPRNGPQLINNDDGFNIAIVSALWLGIHIYGLIPAAKNSIGYNLYTLTPGSEVASLGGGARLWWQPTEIITFGVSAQYGERRSGSYVARGADIELKTDRFGFIGEYAINSSTQNLADSESYYLEPYISLADNRWIFYLSAEYFKSPNRVDILTQIPDPFEKKYFGAGVNWLPLANAKLRLGYLRHDYINEPDSVLTDRDYDAVEISTAIAF